MALEDAWEASPGGTIIEGASVTSRLEAIAFTKRVRGSILFTLA